MESPEAHFVCLEAVRSRSVPPHPLAEFKLIFDFCRTEGSPFMSRLTASPRYFGKCHLSLISCLIWWVFEGSLQPTTHTHTDTGMLISLPLSLFHSGYREGFLWKRGRDNGQFLSRKFILSEREGALKYFNKQDVRHIISFKLKMFQKHFDDKISTHSPWRHETPKQWWKLRPSMPLSSRLRSATPAACRSHTWKTTAQETSLSTTAIQRYKALRTVPERMTL